MGTVLKTFVRGFYFKLTGNAALREQNANRLTIGDLSCDDCFDLLLGESPLPNQNAAESLWVLRLVFKPAR